MKRMLIGALLSGLLALPASAQQPSPSPAPVEQALGRPADDATPARSDATLGRAPSTPPSPATTSAPSTAATTAPAKGYLGIVVAEVPDALRSQLSGVLAEQPGALVVAVQSGSAAASAGLERFDVVVAIDDDPISDPADLVDSVRAEVAGARLTLEVVRAGAKRALPVTLAALPKAAPSPTFDELRHLRIEKKSPDEITVELRFEDAAGKPVECRYTGDRAGIEKQIRQDARLSQARKSYLLDNLNTLSQAGTGALERGAWFFRESPAHRQLREFHDDLFDRSGM